VTDSLFGKLTGRAGHAVIMAIDASCRVENRTQSSTWVMPAFELCLIESESVAGRLCYSITDTLRTGIYCWFPC